MSRRWQWLLRLITRRLWFRAGIYGILAVVTALIARLASPLVPDDLSDIVNAEAVHSILNVVASSMLAVATFSLGTMVAAFTAAANLATPRATKLLVEDPTSQNVLSAFIGAFIFSLAGIFALSAGFYGPGGRVILFAVTLVVITIVIVTLIRWIDYLSKFVRLSYISGIVENATLDAMRSYRDGVPVDHEREPSPPDAFTLLAVQTGYVEHIDVAKLSALANEIGGKVFVQSMPGAFVHPGRAMLRVTKTVTEEHQAAMREAFAIGKTRSFDQDPRFGMIVLSEIGSRALSPGVNDPGTAIDIIGRMVRLLVTWSEDEQHPPEARYTNVSVPPVEMDDLFADAFAPIARDGADMLEVGIRLQKAFATLAEVDPTLFGETARQQSRLALEHALATLTLDHDKQVLRELAARLTLRG